MPSKLVGRLKKDFPTLNFIAGQQFCWSPEHQSVLYQQRKSTSNQTSDWSLLHETAHALLGHKTYQSDVVLLHLEVEAWAKAKELARRYDLQIDNNYIEDCLDTYRDWLYARSICPNCSTQCLQQDNSAYYKCFNCHTIWHVSPNRFCRAYRATKNLPQDLLAPAIYKRGNT